MTATNWSLTFFFSAVLLFMKQKPLKNAATKVEISATIVLFIVENDCRENMICFNEINLRGFGRI